MNILLTCIEYPPFVHRSGLGTHTRLLAEGLAAKGHRVVVLSADERSTYSIMRRGVTVVFQDVREHISLDKSPIEYAQDLCAAPHHSGAELGIFR